jgi:hypothetical protein
VNTASSPPLLPAAKIKELSTAPSSVENEALQTGLAIERPRSALHTGDFTQDEPEHCKVFDRHAALDTNRVPYNSSEAIWLSTSPPRPFTPFQQELRSQTAARPIPDSHNRSRAPSLSSSFSSSFVFKAPTSPLVHSESNDDLEYLSTMAPIDIEKTSMNNRRHTFQPSHYVQNASSMAVSSPFDKPLPHLRRDNPNPYQAHQPRRSISSLPGTPHSETAPQTPTFLRSRRPSFNSDSSPLQLASMVGSYEESILRGRMSTTPSRPLDFVAQIGVLGLGKCKSILRCPAHVTLPFPAVFYRYGNTTHGRLRKSDDDPSPYVGQIDIENGLPHVDEPSHDQKRRRTRMMHSHQNSGDVDGTDSAVGAALSEHEIRRAQKQKRRSTSPKAPPGGSYRIPEKGQLQIIIKNPNKTAVKLFLVPYDLAGMEPGTKTFIRQRSYSAGPIIDTPLSSSPQTQMLDASKDRSILRYLIHLHICCPSRGRFFLYKSIRVVFANRVPDGKEKLRNEIQLPEPRFSVYKPNRESSGGLGHGSAIGAALAAEKAYRRRSSGFPLSPSHRAFDAMDGIAQSLQASIAGGSTYPHVGQLSTTLVDPIPFSLFQRKTSTKDDDVQMQSPTSSKSSRPTTQDSGLAASWASAGSDIGGYDKLNKGDVGYGGNAFAGLHNGQQAATEGLLAKKLKGLGVGKMGQESPTGSI